MKGKERKSISASGFFYASSLSSASVTGCDRADPDMMLRAAALLLGLVLWVRAEVAPPTLNISLDDDPKVRWEPLSKAFDVEYLKKAAAEIIE